MTDLDRVHARLLLIETLRDTAPKIGVWSDQLLGDAYDLVRELEADLSREILLRASSSG